MIRRGGLYSGMCSFEFLLGCVQRAARAKRHRPDVAEYLFRKEFRVLELLSQLQGRSWQPKGYRQFLVRHPRPRLISAAPFCDRVLHHALVSCLEKVFEPTFIHHSYASRVGKGTHRAMRQLRRWTATSEWVLKLDVAQFFPSLEHATLLSLLARKIKDPDVLTLCGRILRASPVGECGAGRGLPIGNQTSQFWANVYLNPLDHYALESLGCRKYLRYMDDIVILGSSQAELVQVWKALECFLESRLRISFRPHKCYLARTHFGLAFVGYRVYPDRVRLLRSGLVRGRRRLRRLQRLYQEGAVDLASVRASIMGWLGHVRQANSWHLCQALLKETPFSLA